MTAKQFLLKHNQTADSVDVNACIKDFTRQMALGLSGNEQSLPMIPTYLSVDRSKIVANERKILIDAGGTNFRSAVGYFDNQGKAVIESLQKTIMPASNQQLTKEQFYNQIAQNVSNLLPQGGDIGFCFSYQVDMNKDIDGTVGAFSKEVKAPEVVGTQVGKETLSACKQYSEKNRKICILNDTVATLLGGMATNNQQFSTYLGYIYGTGTNVCCIVPTSAITKVKDLPQGKMLINTECGCYDGFVQGDFDKIVASQTAQPTKSLFEKMTSGKYLASVIYQALLCAKQEGAFAQEVNLTPFELKDVSLFLQGQALTEMFACSQDVEFAQDVCRLLVERSALLGAIVNSALAIYSCEDKSLPVAIVCEGTTFNKLPGYRSNFEKFLTDILGKNGISYQILQGQDLNLVGTLLATFAL